MILKDYCPTCKKVAKTIRSNKFGSLICRYLDCGHMIREKELQVSDFTTFVSEDEKVPYQFQIEGALFGIKSGARCLIEDEPGLGKTIQALMIIWSLRKECQRLGIKLKHFRFLIVCKRRLMIQWFREINRWCGEDIVVQLIETEKSFILPGTAGFIISYDTLWRFKDLPAWRERAGVTVLICDEVQNIKNAEAKRTKAVQTIAQQVKHIIFLSGTPIKNHAGEFFPALNMLRPDLFPRKNLFEMQWVDTYWDGKSMKYGGIKNPQRFKEYTKDFIIRRTRQEVMPQLPLCTRDFRFSELGEVVEEAYQSEVRKFQDYYYNNTSDSAFVRQSNILAYLARMRHLTGISKIEPTVEEVEEFIMETDRKLVIFVHHELVAKTLVEKLEQRREQWPSEWGQKILYLPAGASQSIIDDFALPGNRIMVTTTLSAGEGLNLQFCSDCIIMEREWNPPNEEQAEGRFIRIGQNAVAIFAKYMIATGTVDEFLTKLVEKKRSFMASTLDGKVIAWEESSLINELAAEIAKNGGRQWGW